MDDNKINILFIGDIVGSPGRDILRERLPEIKERYKIDFCIANAENSAGGAGITPKLVDELISYGIDVLTGGDHVFSRKEIIPYLSNDPPLLLRPHNYPLRTVGQGYTVMRVKNKEQGVKVGVIHLAGRVFMKQVFECPFRTADKLINFIRRITPIIVVDFHAETTSEKMAFSWFVDGRVSFVAGTHTHIQTADERILPKGTAYITDVGMTGPYDSVIGRRVDKVLSAILFGMPQKFDVASDNVKIGAAMVVCDVVSGKALSIERLKM